MKIVISPAKSLDYESDIPVKEYTTCGFLKEAERLNKVLKKKSPRVLAKLMHISNNLAELNWQRNQDWKLPFTTETARPAVYAFKGTVYEGLDAYTLNKEQVNVLQDKLRILSGQYGLLKPLDLMEPYRLEMGTKLKNGKHNNLYQFWDTKITDALNAELTEGEPFINLASNEYFKAVEPKLLKTKVITPVFKEFKNDQYKVIGFLAKKARGLMVRYIIDKDIETVDDIKKFDYEGYAYDDKLSTDTEFVFTRQSA